MEVKSSGPHIWARKIDAPDLASLRTMYRRRRTLFEQQDLACSVLGFHDVTEAQRRALVRAINAELSRTSDRQRLPQFARRWLYDHKQIIPRERELRGYIAKAIRQHEATLLSEIVEAIDPDLLTQWKRTITQPREDGATVQRFPTVCFGTEIKGTPFGLADAAAALKSGGQ